MMNWVKGLFGSGGDQPRNGASQVGAAGAGSLNSDIVPSPYLNMTDEEIRESIKNELKETKAEEVEAKLNTAKHAREQFVQAIKAQEPILERAQAEKERLSDMVADAENGKVRPGVLEALNDACEAVRKHEIRLLRLERLKRKAEKTIEVCTEWLEEQKVEDVNVPDVSKEQADNDAAIDQVVRDLQDDRSQMSSGIGPVAVPEVKLSTDAQEAIEAARRRKGKNNPEVAEQMDDLKVPKQAGRQRGDVLHKPQGLI